jgi:hypothetical protein
MKQERQRADGGGWRVVAVVAVVARVKWKADCVEADRLGKHSDLMELVEDPADHKLLLDGL